MGKTKDKTPPPANENAAAPKAPKACAHPRAYVCTVGSGQLVKRCPECGAREAAPANAKPAEKRPRPLGHGERYKAKVDELGRKIARKGQEIAGAGAASDQGKALAKQLAGLKWELGHAERRLANLG